MPKVTPKFVRRIVAELFEQYFVSGTISQRELDATHERLRGDAGEQLFHEVIARSPLPVRIAKAQQLRLIYLREMDGSEFPFVLTTWRPKQSSARHASCFVGHRFLPTIEGPLRYNLAHVFNPYRIRLRWSAQDLSASGVFADIVKGIRNATMCFFDSHATEGKPNVFIEVGMAYALGVPMIFAEHISSPASESIPSDLQGLFRIQYASYQELFRKLYFGLPNFIAKNRIRR